MSAADPLAARIDGLEATVAFQERTIEELNEAIGAQWKELDAMKRELANLGSQLRQLEANPALAPGSEPPPPHY
jgi:SlyX protein